jgi:hypothetical protein
VTGDIDFAATVSVLFGGGEAGFHTVAETIGHGDEFHVGIGGEGLCGGAGAASAAADEADTQEVACGVFMGAFVAEPGLVGERIMCVTALSGRQVPIQLVQNRRVLLTKARWVLSGDQEGTLMVPWPP